MKLLRYKGDVREEELLSAVFQVIVNSVKPNVSTHVPEVSLDHFTIVDHRPTLLIVIGCSAEGMILCN